MTFSETLLTGGLQRWIAAIDALDDVMELRARVFAMILGFVVLLLVVNLVRTRKLKEEFALLWLFTGVILVAVPLLIDYLDMVAYALGVEYPPALIFVLAIISLLLILFQFSLRISRHSEHMKVLIQELALLRARINDLEQASGDVQDPSTHGRTIVTGNDHDLN